MREVTQKPSEMSNKTFNVSMNQLDCPRPFELQLGLPSDGHYGRFISLLPESAHERKRAATFSPDVDTEASPPNKGSPVEHLHPCSASANLNQTFLTTPTDGRLHLWNANLTPMGDHGTGLEMKRAYTDNGRHGSATSPDSAGGESLAGSREASFRGSVEDRGCSLSSEEMVIRSNSFCQEDRSPFAVSSLEDSPMCLAAACQSLAAGSQLSEGETSPGNGCEEETGLTSLGLTFTRAELPMADSDMAAESLVDLPSEKEGLFMTFVCEPSPVDFGNEAQFPAESEGLFSTSVTPEQGKIVLAAPSIAEGTTAIQTSTPIQDAGNQIPSRRSVSGSPGCGEAAGPELHAVEGQQTSAASKQKPPSAGKTRKLQLKKFPRADFSNIKSKVVTRNVAPVKTGSANVDNKRVEGSVRTSPTRARGAAAVSTATRMIKDAQKGQGPPNVGLTATSQSAVDQRGKNGPEPHQNPPTDTSASAVQCRNASSETEHSVPCQVADAATHHAGNQAFCLSSREKSPGGSGQIDLKPTPKKHAKIEDRAGSASDQSKPSLFRTRLRCSSERSASSSQTPKERKIKGKFSNSFSLPHTAALTKRKDLSAPQDKQAAQAEDKKGQETQRRGPKKISLFVSRNQ